MRISGKINTHLFANLIDRIETIVDD